MSASPLATVKERVVADADTVAEAATVGPARRWRPGATTGVVAAATTGAAANSGLPSWQIGFAAAVFALLVAVQLRRALAAFRSRCRLGGRAGFVLRQVAPSLLAGPSRSPPSSSSSSRG